MFLQGKRTSVIQQRKTGTTDGAGGQTEAWATQDTFDAILNPLSPKENIQYGKDTTISMYKLYIEVSGRDITEQDRFSYGGKILEILGVENSHEADLLYKIILEETQ